jgi:hypothetical protein
MVRLQSPWSPVPTHRQVVVADGVEAITTARLVRRSVSALVVVLLNMALVLYVATEASASPPSGHPLRASGPASDAQAPSTADPATPITDPAPVTDTRAPTPTIPSISTGPMTTTEASPTPTSTASPVTVAPAPSFAEHLVPAPSSPDPTSNIAPFPNFLGTCGSVAYNDEPDCLWLVVAAIDNARAIEGLAPMVLPTNWTALTAPEQLFVATDLERTARGLAPLSAMAGALDVAAAQSAAAGADPALPPGFAWTSYGSNWAGTVANPLEAIYYWMYDDGLGSSNIDCSASNRSACWEHRRNVLLPLVCDPCVMGAGWSTTTNGTWSVTELIVDTRGSPSSDFTWAQEQPDVP